MTKKQFEFMAYLELIGFINRSEVCKSRFPDSVIDALIRKGYVSESDGVLISEVV